jgi:hypothetical protein
MTATNAAEGEKKNSHLSTRVSHLENVVLGELNCGRDKVQSWRAGCRERFAILGLEVVWASGFTNLPCCSKFWCGLSPKFWHTAQAREASLDGNEGWENKWSSFGLEPDVGKTVLQLHPP